MGGWAQAITSGIGRAGAETGQAVDQNIQTALSVIQQRLMASEIQQRLQESQLRTKAMTAPQFQTLPTPGGGTVGVMTDPFTHAPLEAPQTIIPGQVEPKTLDQGWYDAIVRETGKPPTSAQINEHQQEGKNPINALLWQGIQAQQSGDTASARTLFQLAQTARGVQKGPSSPTLMSLVTDAQQGKPGAQDALRSYMAMQTQLAEARGEGLGKGRAAYQIGAYEDPATGQIIPMSNLDAINAIQSGRNLIPSGRLPAQTAIAAQQLVSEAKPALAGVRKYLDAFDNAADRGIFARVLSSNPAVTPGFEQQWLGTILNQALQSGLSTEGRGLVIQLNRLNESVGRLRSVLGLPATQSMTAMTLAMVPGPATPDKDFAVDMLNNLDQTITNAISIPALGGGGGGVPPTGGGGKPTSSETIDLTK